LCGKCRKTLSGLRDIDLPLAAPQAPEPAFDQDGDAGLLALPLRGRDSDVVAAAVERLRAQLEQRAPAGLQTAVTGPAGFSTDLKNVFAGADTRLLAVTGGLVPLLLIAIYRSPIFWLVPFFTVLLTEGATRGLAALLGEAGLVVNGQNAGILSVLVFGAATDYALLLVARYREELTRHAQAAAAMEQALRGAAPAILASGATVIAGLLTLIVVSVDSSASIGPLGAAGIVVALALSLTLLPATLVIAGRRPFWPLIPRDGDDIEHAHRVWRRLGGVIAARPRPLWIGSTIVLIALALGLTGLDTSLTQEQQLRGNPPRNATERGARRRPVLPGRGRRSAEAPRRGPHRRAASPRRRPDRAILRPARSGRPRQPRDPTAHARRRAARPDRAPARTRRPCPAPARDRALGRRRTGSGRRDLRPDPRPPRGRPHPAPARLRLSRRPRNRLHHLPHGPRPRRNDPARRQAFGVRRHSARTWIGR
jgi:RND superfamily putative drug exporter